MGSLMNSMVCTKPNLAHAMSVIRRFMANLGKAHWNAIKWVFKCLKGTIDMALSYGGEKQKRQQAFLDT